VPDPRDSPWDSLYSPLPPFINTGSAESPQTSSALLRELTSDCTWICKNLWAEETATAPNGAVQTRSSSAASERRRAPSPPRGPSQPCSSGCPAPGSLAPHAPPPAPREPPGPSQPRRAALLHRKRIKVASPVPPARGYLVPLLRNSGRARKPQFALTFTIYTALGKLQAINISV